MSKKKHMTAKEFMDILEKDEEWQKAHAERMRRHDESVAKLQEEIRAEHQSLLKDLATVGLNVSSVYDLVNTRQSYPQGVPILITHLKKVNHPVMRQGIGRSLTVAEARGVAGQALINEILSGKDPVGSEPRWCLANALVVAADQNDKADIERMLADASYSDLHERLTAALKRLNRERRRKK